MPTDDICWIDGAVVPASEARVSVLDHGLLYGDGVFEGIRFYHGRPFRLTQHLDRLDRSARAIALDVPLARQALVQAIEHTVSCFDKPNGYLRLVVTRGVGSMGIDPLACDNPQLFIIAGHLRVVSADTRDEGIRVITASTRRLPSDGLDARIKSLNYLNHILARIEANHAGADEAVLLNAHGRVAEASVENLFIVRDGELLTPPGIEGALEGITRQCVCEAASDIGIAVREAPLAPYDLYNADECFLSGTGAELIAVREVDGRHLPACPGPVFDRVQTAFRALVNRECAA